MERIFGRPIVTQEQMRTRIRELGRQIASDYAGKDLVLVGVLKGAVMVMADLARALSDGFPGDDPAIFLSEFLDRGLDDLGSELGEVRLLLVCCLHSLSLIHISEPTRPY